MSRFSFCHRQMLVEYRGEGSTHLKYHRQNAGGHFFPSAPTRTSVHLLPLRLLRRSGATPRISGLGHPAFSRPGQARIHHPSAQAHAPHVPPNQIRCGHQDVPQCPQQC